MIYNFIPIAENHNCKNIQITNIFTKLLCVALKVASNKSKLCILWRMASENPTILENS